MRKLQTHDVFKALRLIRIAGIKEEFEKVARLMQENKQIDASSIGYSVIFGCLEKVSGTEGENAFYDLISGPLEVSPKDVREMDPMDLIKAIEGLKEVISVEEWTNFFKSVSGLILK